LVESSALEPSTTAASDGLASLLIAVDSLASLSIASDGLASLSIAVDGLASLSTATDGLASLSGAVTAGGMAFVVGIFLLTPQHRADDFCTTLAVVFGS
jgi:hypothetical protein